MADQIIDFTKITSDSVIEAIYDAVKNTNDHRPSILEDFNISFGNLNFAFICTNEGKWDDEGKYQFQLIEYQLVSYDNSNDSYPTYNNIIDRYDVVFELSISRSGSYFSDYYYNIESIIPYRITEILVPDVIIPAHNEIKFENIAINGVIIDR